jgi:hypothetical protein
MAPSLAVGLLAASALAAPPLSIRDIAPKSSVLVVGADDLAGAWGRFQKTPLWGLWKSEEFQKAFAPMMEQMNEAMEESARDLGRPDASWTAPASFGFALYPMLDEELGLERPCVIGFIDWGAGGGSLELLEAMLDDFEKDGALGRTDLRGEVVRTIDLGDGEEEMDENFDDLGGFLEPDLGFDDIETLYIHRAGDRHLFTTDLVALEEMLSSIDDRGGAASIGTSDDFTDTMDLLRGPDLYGMLFTANAQRMLSGGDMAFMLATAQPIVSRLFGDIRTHAFGLEVGGEGDAMIDQTIAMTVPGEKAGLLGLITMESPVAAPPAMVPADAMGYGRINVRFDRIMPTIREVVDGLGEMERQQIEGALMQFGPMLEQAFASMDPSVQIFNRVRMPIDVDSMETLVAIPCNDPTQVEPMIALAGPGMGLMRRDFQGQAIYSDEFSPMAIGLGQGHVLIGAASAVEQVLRGGAVEAEETFADTKAARDAMRAFGDKRVVGFGFSDVIASLRVQQKLMADLGVFEEMELALDDDPDGGLPDMDFGEVDFEALLDPDLWKRYLGPAIWDFTVADRGFVMSSRLLPPVE